MPYLSFCVLSLLRLLAAGAGAAATTAAAPAAAAPVLPPARTLPLLTAASDLVQTYVDPAIYPINGLRGFNVFTARAIKERFLMISPKFHITLPSKIPPMIPPNCAQTPLDIAIESLHNAAPNYCSLARCALQCLLHNLHTFKGPCVSTFFEHMQDTEASSMCQHKLSRPAHALF